MVDQEKLRELWVKVLFQAALDTTLPKPSMPPKAATDPKVMTDHLGRVHQWKIQLKSDNDYFNRPGSDFYFVCEMAGFDPEMVLAAWHSGKFTREAIKARTTPLRNRALIIGDTQSYILDQVTSKWKPTEMLKRPNGTPPSADQLASLLSRGLIEKREANHPINNKRICEYRRSK